MFYVIEVSDSTEPLRLAGPMCEEDADNQLKTWGAAARSVQTGNPFYELTLFEINEIIDNRSIRFTTFGAGCGGIYMIRSE